MGRISAPSQGRHASCRVRARPDSETAASTCGGRSVGLTVHVRSVSPENCPALVLERGLPSAQLLSAVDLVLAGRDQGGLPRPGQHRLRIRHAGAQPELRDAAALGGVAEELRQAVALSRLHPVQRVPARPLHLPILRRSARTSPSTMSFRARRAGSRPGRTWSPPARTAI